MSGITRMNDWSFENRLPGEHRRDPPLRALGVRGSTAFANGRVSRHAAKVAPRRLGATWWRAEHAKVTPKVPADTFVPRDIVVARCACVRRGIREYTFMLVGRYGKYRIG